MDDLDFAFIVLIIFGIVCTLGFAAREARNKTLASQYDGVPVCSEQMRLKN